MTNDGIPAVDSRYAPFLMVVRKLGGRAKTSEITKAMPDLSRDQINTRYDQMAERGFIEVDRETEPSRGGPPQRIAVLTDDGEAALENYLAHHPVDPETIAHMDVEYVTAESLERELLDFSDRLNGISRRASDNEAAVEDMREDVDELEAAIDEMRVKWSVLAEVVDETVMPEGESVKRRAVNKFMRARDSDAPADD